MRPTNTSNIEICSETSSSGLRNPSSPRTQANTALLSDLTESHTACHYLNLMQDEYRIEQFFHIFIGHVYFDKVSVHSFDNSLK